jgi:hypothetical protein
MTRIEIGVAAFILITPGCAASHQPTTSGLAPVSPAAVQVFLDREPGRPYVSIGRITIEHSRHEVDEIGDRALEDARSNAAAMGADAILVTSIPASANRVMFAEKRSETGSGTVEMRSVARPALDVMAVVWTCGSD